MAILFRVVLLSLLYLLPLFLGGASPVLSGETRGLNLLVRGEAGKTEQVDLYGGSHALLVGVSRYHAGWPMLESIPGELDKVEQFLAERGFNVRKVMDPDGDELVESFEQFIGEYGYDPQNRLLFFFSGHGYTRSNGKRGYLVPVDAPDPDRDLTGFLKKALGMNQVLSWARDIESKHALFLFDSCFSGTIFKQKSRIPPPRHITRLTVEPVRQFITAGGAGEEVPANSTFTPVFIDGLRHGLADLNRDGYVSATELGIYLQTEVPQHTDQNPQFGKIRDYDLSRGDFIFMTDRTFHNGSGREKVQDNSHSAISRPIISGMLRLESDPDKSTVYLDDVVQGTTPLILSNVSPGSHELRLEKEGYFGDSRKVEVPPGKHLAIKVPLIPVSGGIGVQPVNVAGDEDVDSVTGVEGEPEGPIVETSSDADALQTASLKPEKVKVVHKRSSGLPAEVEEQIENLRSGDSATRRYAAKVIYRQNLTHPAILAEVEKQLLDGYLKYQDDRQHLDALAWLCNILGRTTNTKYQAALSRVASSETPRKVRRYAEKNLRILKGK